MTSMFAITLFSLCGACLHVVAFALWQSHRTTRTRLWLLCLTAILTAATLALRALNAPAMDTPPLLWGALILTLVMYGTLTLHDLAYIFPARLWPWLILSVLLMIAFVGVSLTTEAVWVGWAQWSPDVLPTPGLLALLGMIALGSLLMLLLLRRLVQPQLPQVFDRAGLWTVATLLFIGGIILMSNGRGLFGVIGGLAQLGSLILATYTTLQYQPAFVNILYAHMQPQPALPVKAIHQQLAETNIPGDAIRAISAFTQAYLHIDGLQLLRPSLAESASAKGLDVEATPITLSIDSPIWLAFMQQQAIRQYDLRYHAAFADAPPTEKGALIGTNMLLFIPLLVDGRCAVIFAFDKKQNGLPYTFAEINILRACIDQLGTALTARPMHQTILSLDQSLLRAKGEIKKLEAIKSDFITIASHELRTPLAQMRGYVDIVESIASDPSVDAAQRDKIFNNLRKSANRLEEIVSAMLDASQLEVGEMDFKFVSAKPETLLKLVTDPLKDPIAERSLTLTINDMSDLPPIRADMPRLVQAMRNVLINAIRYTPDEGHISISAVVADDARDFVRFAIADTGIGIDPAQTTLIFEKFYRGFDTQLHSTGAYKFMGAGPGLGLTIANGIIKAHGGKIVASSAGRDIEKHLGSTFYIDLPIEEESSAETVGTRPSEMQP